MVRIRKGTAEARPAKSTPTGQYPVRISMARPAATAKPIESNRKAWMDQREPDCSSRS
jgi:hypothetical protein